MARSDFLSSFPYCKFTVYHTVECILRTGREGTENGPCFQLSFKEKINMARDIATVGLFILLFLFALSGCIAVNIDRATQAFIQQCYREKTCAQ